MTKGRLYAMSAFILWGVFPLYWKMLQAVPAAEILVHRMVWSFVFMVITLAAMKHWRWIPALLKKPKTLLVFAGSASLISLNWFIFIWAINNGYVVDVSLGYFITPLINVLMGLIFLSEKLRWGQWTAIALAAAGVLYLMFGYGSLPWIALVLAFSFSLYGFLKKTAGLNPFEGLSLEMAILIVPALSYVLYLEFTGAASFGRAGAQTTLLLVLGGAVTAIPLLLFAAGARRVTLATLGILQYIAPTLQFLIGVFVFGEAFSQSRLIGFGLVWLALFLYLVEGVISERCKAALQYAG